MKCATPENLNIEAKVDNVTKSLINAYKNANNRNTKTQSSVCMRTSIQSVL